MQPKSTPPAPDRPTDPSPPLESDHLHGERSPGTLPNPERARLPVERLAYRLDELAAALGVSRRTIERERSAGRFPAPDRRIGKAPIWSRDTLIRWLAGEGGRR